MKQFSEMNVIEFQQTKGEASSRPKSDYGEWSRMCQGYTFRTGFIDFNLPGTHIPRCALYALGYSAKLLISGMIDGITPLEKKRVEVKRLLMKEGYL